MFRYEIQAGEEHRVFGGDGVRNLGNGIVESDHELISPWLKDLTESADRIAATEPVLPPAPQTPNPPAPELPAVSAAEKADEGRTTN